MSRPTVVASSRVNTIDVLTAISLAIQRLVWTSAGVYFPNQNRWTDVAPRWAADSWETVHQKLRSWCEEKGIQLIVDEISDVYAE